MNNASELADYVEHFRKRVLQQALAEATAAYWERRAKTFLAVGTPECDQIAQACRNRAALALRQEVPAAVVCVVCDTPTSPWTCSCGATRIGVAS